MLGAALCLLAAAFALEAKLGWYSPNDNVRVEFSSIKLQSADASRQAVEGVAVPAPVPQFPGEIPLLLAIAAVLSMIFIPGRATNLPAHARFSFTPFHFFRPPPRS